MVVKTFLFNIFILVLDIQQYISSGILELYALDTLSEKEKQQVNSLLQTNEGARKELESIQLALEKYAHLHAISPPNDSLGQILHVIDNLEDTQKQSTSNSQAVTKNKTNNTTAIKRIRRLQYLAAAAMILLFISAALNWNYNLQLKNANSELTALRQDQEVIANNLNVVKEELSILQNHENKIIKLAGVETHPESFVYVYWNTGSEEVFVKIGDLPIPPTEKQYQLWALKDGKPIDAGVFDVEDGILKVKSIAAADAFAVTLEPKGGSESPTLEEMYVMGNVKVI